MSGPRAILREPHLPLRLLREQRGLTLAQVAADMAADQSDLSRLETGQLLAAKEYLARYARALRVQYRRVLLAYYLTHHAAAVRRLEWADREIVKLYRRNRA